MRPLYNGVVKNYIPDFLIKLKNDTMLVLEVKGQKSEEVTAKREALEDWIEAVNNDGSFGEWYSDTSYNVKDIDGIIAKYCE